MKLIENGMESEELPTVRSEGVWENGIL